MTSFSRCFLIGSLFLSVSTLAFAESAYVSLTGDFPTAGNQHDFFFGLTRRVGSGVVLRFETIANGGGMNAAGETIPAGGIDSELELFDSTGGHHGYNDDGSFTPGTDSLLSWLGVAQSDNVPLNPDPLPAADYRLNMKEFGNNTAGHWALDLVGPADALVFMGDRPTGASPSSTLNTLTAGNGAQVRFTGFYDLEDNQVFTLQSGANFTLENYLDIGKGSPGTLIVENPGTTLTTNTITDTYLYWGRAGSVAQVFVRDGAMANFQATRIDIAADTDPGSAGVLWVESSADVTTNTLNVGTGVGSGTGQIVLFGESSTLTQNGAAELTVGAPSGGVDDFLSVMDHSTFNSGTGAITVNPSGYIAVDNATFNANGPLTVASTGPVSSFGVNLANEGHIHSVDVTVGTNVANGSVRINGSVPGVGLPATWQVTDSMTIGSAGFGSGWTTVEDAGLLDISNNLTVAGSMDATGTLTVQTNGEVTVGNQLTIADSGTVNLLGSQITAGSFIVQPFGTFTHEDGTLTVDGGTFTIQLGTHTIESGGGAGLPTLRLDNGAQGSVEAVSGLSSGLLTVGDNGRGRMEIVGGSRMVSGGGRIADGYGIALPNSADGFVLVQGDASVWELTAEAGDAGTWSEALMVGQRGLGRLEIRDGGQVLVRQGNVWIGGPEVGPLGFYGRGSVLVDGSGSLLQAEGGTLTIGGSDMKFGALGGLTVSNGGRVEADNIVRYHLGCIRLESGGEIQTTSFGVAGVLSPFTHYDGTLTVDGGTFDPGDGDYTLDGFNPTDLPVVRLTGGATGLFDDFQEIHVGYNNRGRLEILSGSSVNKANSQETLRIGASLGSDGEVIVDGQGSQLETFFVVVGQSGRGVLRILNGGSLNDQSFSEGEIGWGNGSEGTVEVSGIAPDSTPSSYKTVGLRVGSEGRGTLEITGGGLVNTLGQAAIAAHTGSDGSSATVTDSGSRWDTGLLYVGGRELSTGGTGTLTIANNGLVTAGSVKVWQPGTVELDGAVISTSTLELAGGTLQGNGTVQVSGALSNGGEVSPGFSPGVITVAGGNYVQDATGTLAIEIGGTLPAQYDRLSVVSGTATLGGSLDVSLIDPLGGNNMFVPSAGDTYEIFTAGELTGAFSSETFPDIPGKPGLHFLIDYDTTLDRVLLSVAPYFEADFNEDEDVDGNDLTIWEAGYGAGTLHTQGDADADGDVDGNDYLIWQRQLGSGGGGSLAAVPEPGTLALLILAAANTILQRRACSVGRVKRRTQG